MSIQETNIDKYNSTYINAANLNYPYYTYPHINLCEYQNIDRYNTELIRLYKNLESLLSKDNEFLFHITIGAAMEEAYDNDIYTSYNNQWTQLFPEHLFRLIINNLNTQQQNTQQQIYKREIIHYIISPNESFNPDNIKFPRFIRETAFLQWEYNKEKIYFYSKIYPIKVYIFNTMMPTIDVRNDIILQQLNKIQEKLEYKMNLDKYKQSDYDRTFVKQFYMLFNNLFYHLTSINALVSCFSFAVFNEDTDFSTIMDYSMFKSIKKIFTKFNKFILAEWTFKPDCYTVRLYDKFHKFNDRCILIKYNNSNNNKEDYSIDISSGISSTSFILQKSSAKSLFNT